MEIEPPDYNLCMLPIAISLLFKNKLKITTIIYVVFEAITKNRSYSKAGALVNEHVIKASDQESFNIQMKSLHLLKNACVYAAGTKAVS